MPKASFHGSFLPSVRDLAFPGDAEHSVESLLDLGPDGLSLLLFWNLGSSGSESQLPVPSGLEFLPGPPLAGTSDSLPFLSRLSRLAHKAGIPLEISSRLLLDPAKPQALDYASLTRRAMTLAKLSDRLGAKTLILGSFWEQGPLILDPSQIQAILGAARSIFHGRVFLGRSLDEIRNQGMIHGSDGLALGGPFRFPLTSSKPSLSSLLRSARSWVRLAAAHAPLPRFPVKLAECGWPSCGGGLAQPLAAPGEVQDLEGPFWGLKALHEAFSSLPSYAGTSTLGWTSQSLSTADTTIRLQGKNILPRFLELVNTKSKIDRQEHNGPKEDLE
jgi:hypothetical protein